MGLRGDETANSPSSQVWAGAGRGGRTRAHTALSSPGAGSGASALGIFPFRSHGDPLLLFSLTPQMKFQHMSPDIIPLRPG